MNTPIMPITEAPKPAAEAAPAQPTYGAALMEAVRPKNKPYAGYGAARPNMTRPGGAPSSATTPAQATPATRPAPMPKRPKGRLFIASFLMAVTALGATTLFNATLRYESYGVVSGQLVEVPPPWAGVVSTLHVREGEEVRQGQLLATIMNHDLEQQHARLGDDILIEQAAMQSTSASIKLDARLRGDLRSRAQGDYLELWAQLLEEQHELVALSNRRAHLERQYKTNAQPITAIELQEALQSEKGQREKVEKLSQAVDELKRRVQEFPVNDDDAGDRLRPHQTRMEALQTQLVRAQNRLHNSEIRAPANGRIVRVCRFAGEFVAEGQTVLELLVDGSVNAVLYIDQQDAGRYQVGKTIDVNIAPNRSLTRCEILRIGDRLERPPINIELYYRKDEKLLPITLLPIASERASVVMKLGAEIRLPTSWVLW